MLVFGAAVHSQNIKRTFVTYFRVSFPVHANSVANEHPDNIF